MAEPVRQLKLNPAGTHVAILADSGELRIWEWKNDQRRLVDLNSDSKSVAKAIQWSNDGQMLAVSVQADDAICEIVILKTSDWTIARRIPVSEVMTRFGDLASIQFSHDDRFLVASGSKIYDYVILVLNVDDWSRLEVKKLHSQEFNSVNWHPTEHRLLMSSQDAQVFTWNLDDDSIANAKTETFMQHSQWCAKGTEILVSGNGSIRFLDGESLKIKRVEFVVPDGVVYSAAHPNGLDVVASANQTGLYALISGYHPKRVLKNIQSNVSDCQCFVHWSPDGELIATSTEPPVTLWHSETGKPIFGESNEYTIFGQSLGWLDNHRFVTYFRDEIHFWDRLGRQLNRTFNKDRSGKGNVIEFDSSNQRLMFETNYAYTKWQFYFWDIKTEEYQDIMPPREGRLFCHGALNPQGDTIAVCNNRKVLLIDSVDGSVEDEVTMDETMTAVAWNKDGSRLAAGGRDRNITLFEITKVDQSTEMRKLRVLEGHSGKIATLDWSPDGKRIASAAYDNTIRLWDPNRGKSTIILKTDSVVGALKWSPEGQRLASMSQNGTGIVWDATRGYSDP